MTTTANAMLENCCSPCNDCGWGCKNDCPVNIQSTNPDCLRVDTSECWVVKLEPTCPKTTYVGAWDNVVIEEVTPPDDCYMNWWDCWIKGWWKVNATDEKVKVCEDDTTPGYLDAKLEAWTWITLTPIGCDYNNAVMRISINEEELPDCDIPPIKVNNDANTVMLAVSWDDWHTLTITDKSTETYDNMCCIGFRTTISKSVNIDTQTWNAVEPAFIDSWRTIFTGNPEMATRQWIYIVQDWYYRVFWQLTVKNNTWSNTYLNLWRWLLKITSATRKMNGLSERFMSTAKHWAYARQVLLQWGWSVGVDNNWLISTNLSWSQTKDGFDWPWMTLNIDCLVDMRAWEYITLWYRPQSDMPDSRNNRVANFAFVWADDSTTEFSALFWWTVLWVYMLAPKLFQSWTESKVYWNIL